MSTHRKRGGAVSAHGLTWTVERLLTKKDIRFHGSTTESMVTVVVLETTDFDEARQRLFVEARKHPGASCMISATHRFKKGAKP